MCAACRALWDRRVQTTPFILSCGRVDCTTSFILSCGVRELLRSLNSKPNYNKAPQERSWGTRLIQRDSPACWHWPLGLCLVSVAGLAQVPAARVSCGARLAGRRLGRPVSFGGLGSAESLCISGPTVLLENEVLAPLFLAVHVAVGACDKGCANW